VLEELQKILDYEGKNPQIRELIMELQDEDLTEDQQELIYELCTSVYEMKEI